MLQTIRKFIKLANYKINIAKYVYKQPIRRYNGRKKSIYNATENQIYRIKPRNVKDLGEKKNPENIMRHQ